MEYKYTTPRRPISAMATSPGPMSYGMPTLLGHVRHDPRSGVPRQPAFTFGLSLASTRGFHKSPGFRTLTDKVYRNGKENTPQPTIKGRLAGIRPLQTPSPQLYFTMKADSYVFRSRPSYTIGCRPRHRSLTVNPAANVYHVTRVSDRRAPTYTIQCRRAKGGFAQDLAKPLQTSPCGIRENPSPYYEFCRDNSIVAAPGPGTYDETNTSVYKNRLPHYSMAARVFPPGDPTQKPGPGAHRPEDARAQKQEGPMFSFGLRHSQYVTPVTESPMCK